MMLPDLTTRRDGVRARIDELVQSRGAEVDQVGVPGRA